MKSKNWFSAFDTKYIQITVFIIRIFKKYLYYAKHQLNSLQILLNFLLRNCTLNLETLSFIFNISIKNVDYLVDFNEKLKGYHNFRILFCCKWVKIA